MLRVSCSSSVSPPIQEEYYPSAVNKFVSLILALHTESHVEMQEDAFNLKMRLHYCVFIGRSSSGRLCVYFMSSLWKDPHLELAGVELRRDVCRLLLLIRKSSERMIVCE